MKQNNSAHVSEKMYDEYWSTSFFFWVGLHKDASEIIKAIDSLALTDDDLKFQKVFNHGNFLLAAYLTPYKDICDSVALALNHAAELYQDITFGKSDSILGCMSEIQLLCMFTQALVDSFSYEFFARALDEYVRNVAISCDSEELGLLRLFLGNAILVSIDPKRNFDAMLSDYGKGIPLQLQIGIVAHSVDREATTAQVKKMDKNIKKKIRNNPAFKKQLSRYMIDPISEEANKKILALISR